MDTLIDKLSQKKNAQEMIRANMTAEALKMEQLQNQMQTYNEIMQEIRQVNLKTVENVAQVQNALKECVQRLEDMHKEEQADADRQNSDREQQEQQIAQLKEFLEEKFTQSDDFLHKENVKVYRNVQAAVIEELGKQTVELNKRLEGLDQQVEEIKSAQKKNRTSKALLPLSILILLGIIADIVIQVFSVTVAF